MFGRKQDAREQEMTVQALHARQEQGGPPLIVDVRQPDEYQSAHLAGSRLIPLASLAGQLNQLPKTQPIVVICRTGNRSKVATVLLRRAGFDAVNLTGGIEAWQKAGFPVERGR